MNFSHIPGFAYIPDYALQAEKRAFAIHAGRIQDNAAFGMVALEVFRNLYKNGDTVTLPVSTVDGYQYSREECMYFWTVAGSGSPDTGWVSGDAGTSLFLVNWKVDQTTGDVTSEEYYRNSDVVLKTNGKTNDGLLRVFTVAQRQRTTLLIPTPPTYTAHAPTEFYEDRKYNQTLIQDVNHNSQFAVVSTEAFYMGEFVNGQQAPRPRSPIDGYLYTYAECRFVHCWRWSTKSSVFQLPDNFLLQLQDLNCIVDGTGHVSITISYKPEGAVVERSDHGRIAVFAFCRRTTPGLSGVPVNFTEIDPNLFTPGAVLRATELSLMNDNTKIAASSPEFFPVTTYLHGDTVPLPVSPIDSYAYKRAELFYLHDWHSTALPTPPYASDIRLLLMNSFVGQAGTVAITVWRLATGGVPVLTHDGQLDVMVVGIRQAENPDYTAVDITPPDNPSPPPPGGGTGGPFDVFVNGSFVGDAGTEITVNDPSGLTVNGA